MPYLSALLIDVGESPDRPRPARFWLRNRYRVHQRLCMAFPLKRRKDEDPEYLAPYKKEDFKTTGFPPGAEQGIVHCQRSDGHGFLYRIDPLSNNRVMILVQSGIEPDWNYAFHNAMHFLAAPPTIKPYNPRFSMGERLRFLLEANPTRRLSKQSPDAKEVSVGKRVPIPVDRLREWLDRKAQSGGFSVDWNNTMIQTGYAYMNKDGNGRRLRSVRFDGYLEVIEANTFCTTLISGIGSGKAFGFGLLTVSRIAPTTRSPSP